MEILAGAGEGAERSPERAAGAGEGKGGGNQVFSSGLQAAGFPEVEEKVVTRSLILQKGKCW